MTPEEIQNKLNAIEKLRSVVEFAKFMQAYAVETYGINRQPNWKAQQEKTDAAFHALNNVADLVEQELILKKLLNDTGLNVKT